MTNAAAQRLLAGPEGLAAALPLDLELIPLTSTLCSSIYRSRILADAHVTDDDDKQRPWTRRAQPLLSSTGPDPDGDGDGDGLHGWVCTKRVCLEDQCRPHDVEAEVALLSRLRAQHKNILLLLAAVLDSSDPFATTLDLHMPLYPYSLADLLNTHTQDTLDTLFPTVTNQLFSALAFLHSPANRIAHRDIKPANMLLTHNHTLKLIDFGIAIAHKHTDSTFAVSTGCFRAPELLFAPKHGYDPFAIDIWAAAVTLAHFFTPLQPNPSPPRPRSRPRSRPRPRPRPHATRDQRPAWQRALWDDDGTDPYAQSQTESESGSESGSPPSLPDGDGDGDVDGTRTQIEMQRKPLFQANTGEIGLANSIFNLLGRPTVWPEANAFQPPLERFPFPARPPKPLDTALTLLPQASDHVKRIVAIAIEPLLNLSASQRPSAAQVRDRLNQLQQ